MSSSIYNKYGSRNSKHVKCRRCKKVVQEPIICKFCETSYCIECWKEVTKSSMSDEFNEKSGSHKVR